MKIRKILMFSFLLAGLFVIVNVNKTDLKCSAYLRLYESGELDKLEQGLISQNQGGMLTLDLWGNAYDANGNQYFHSDVNPSGLYCIDPATGTQYDPQVAGTITGMGGKPNPNVGKGNGTTSTTTPATPKCDHEYESKVTKEANCTEEGETTYTCTKCGNTYTEPIEPNGKHNYSMEVTTKPSCTEDGVATYTCVICNDTYTEPVKATGHTYSSEETTKPACTENGTITYTCSICKDTYTEEVAALGHNPGEWEVTKDAGLFTDGEKVQKCILCGEELERQTINSTLPVWYLYCGIAAIVLIILIVIILIRKKHRMK